MTQSKDLETSVESDCIRDEMSCHGIWADVKVDYKGFLQKNRKTDSISIAVTQDLDSFESDGELDPLLPNDITPLPSRQMFMICLVTFIGKKSIIY